MGLSGRIRGHRFEESLREQWIQALRDEEYVQGRHFLRRTAEVGGDPFCPLGVLCDLAQRAGVGRWVHADDGSVGYELDGSYVERLPPADLFTRVGVDPEQAAKAALLSDMGWSFDEIARRLEATKRRRVRPVRQRLLG